MKALLTLINSETYMLTALNTKEACSRQKHDKLYDVPQFKISDLIMIKYLDKRSNWHAKYVPDMNGLGY